MNRGIEILPQASYLQNSSWSSKLTKWTPEENKRFEDALAYYDVETPDRWYKIAAMIPGKTVGDVIIQYKELVDDLSDIEAGLVPVSGYNKTERFTLDWGCNDHNDSVLDEFNGYCSPGGKRATTSRPSDHERKKGVPWTEEEHRKFLMGLKKYGKGDWRSISINYVKTRTPTQVASHAQKYYLRQLNGGKDKRRSSIHDITTNNVPDESTPPINNSTSISSPTCLKTEEVYDWKVLNEAASSLYDRNNNSNNNGSSFCGMFSLGTHLAEQNQVRGSLSSSQFGPYTSYLEMQRQ